LKSFKCLYQKLKDDYNSFWGLLLEQPQSLVLDVFFHTNTIRAEILLIQ
jgi:hypothetical protein